MREVGGASPMIPIALMAHEGLECIAIFLHSSAWLSTQCNLESYQEVSVESGLDGTPPPLLRFFPVPGPYL